MGNQNHESRWERLRAHLAAGRPAPDNDHRTLATITQEMTEMDNDIGQMAGALQAQNQTLHQHQDALKNQQDRQAEFGARLLELEQKAVGSGFQPSAATLRNIAADAVDSFQESSSFAALKDWNQGTARANLGASIRAIVNDGHGDTSIGQMPSQPERSGVFGPIQRPLTLLQALPSRPTGSDSVEHVRLHVTGDAELQEKEGDEKAELDFDGELVKARVVTIAGHTTASRQVLSDHAALQSQIDLVITQKVLGKLEHKIIHGQGGDDIDGLLNLATVMIPELTSTPADRIGETVTAMQVLGYLPNLIVMNPRDWLKLGITKTEQEGNYLFGSPVAPVPLVLWRVPVVLSHEMPEGSVLVIDTAHVTVLDREAPSVMVSNSHLDYFTRNLVKILGELRAGLEVRDAQAVFLVELEAGSTT